MAIVTRGYTFGATEQVTASKLHNLADNATVTGIVNADVSNSAGIEDSKLAQILTAGKVSGTALLNLDDIDSSAGIIPSANLPTIAPDSDATLTFTDITTNNSSTSKHGFLKKLSNVATEFMNGVGNWATISSTMAGAKVGTLTISSTGSKVITGLGFRPKLVIFLASYSSLADVKPSFGVFAYDGSSMVGLSALFIAGDTSGEATVGDTFTLTNGGSTIVSVTGTSLDADGFTVNVGTASANYVARYIAIG